MKSLSINEIIDNCVMHGAHVKHFHGFSSETKNKGKMRPQGREFTNPELGKPLKVKSFDQFRQHIGKTLRDPSTYSFKASNNRILYYNTKTNTAIWQNNGKPKGSTCYRPKKKAKSFITTIKGECKALGIDPKKWKSQIQKGGYHKIHGKKHKIEVQKNAHLEKEKRKNQIKSFKELQKVKDAEKTQHRKREQELAKSNSQLRAKLEKQKRDEELKKKAQELKRKDDEKRKRELDLAKKIEEDLRKMRERREKEKQRQKELELQKQLQKKY